MSCDVGEVIENLENGIWYTASICSISKNLSLVFTDFQLIKFRTLMISRHPVFIKITVLPYISECKVQ